jgi:predicted transposase YbfD/YdcC
MIKSKRWPDQSQQQLLEEVRIDLAAPAQIPRIQQLLDQHHYLGGLRPVGERLFYFAQDAAGRWVAVSVFSAAAKHLKHRDEWIGWSEEQRRRRLSLVTNQSRFLLLPDVSVPNLGSRVLRLTLQRLPQDWQTRYGHPVEVVETFVDPEQFNGTVYTASGWIELGHTDGWGRRQRDYYVKHDKPKRLFVRPLHHNSCRRLQAEHLKPDLALLEAKVPARCTKRVKEIRSIVDHFKALPEYRERVESYPLFSLAALIFLAMLCEAPRGQTDLEKFARGLNQGQRRALGIRRNRQGKYPAPSQSTFSRFLAGIDATKLNEQLLQIQRLLRGPAPQELVVLDGKEPKHGSGASVLTAVTVPSQHYLGSAMVDEKTNEIPVAQQELIPPLDLAGRFVSLDALHTQDQTARTVVLEAGGHYLLTVKDNQRTLRATIEKKSPLPKRIFPPQDPTTSQARTLEINKGRVESRVIRTAPVSPEDVSFPFASQAARLLRQTQGRKDEEVALITSAPVSLLPAMLWLLLNRKGWGIESGLHQRLDVSYNDDRCRVQSDNGIWVLGMFRRIANSLFVQWSSYQRRPDHVTTTDFQTLMAENHRAAAVRLVLGKDPSLKKLS